MRQTRPAKDQRERLVLLGLVELYLQSGKPIGSNTLRENGFDHLSSATIRNYFTKLEETGFLKQQHSSGGRIPTQMAYKLYADTLLVSEQKDVKELRSKLLKETREIALYLQSTAEILSEASKCTVFLSAPRFDHDLILDIKLTGIDQNRCLCILITDFGLVHTELLYVDKKLSSFTLKRIESYFHFRLKGFDKPTLSPEEEILATKLYGELMLRHIVGYTNFSSEDIYKTGFSTLLNYPDFNDASSLAQGLALFENPTHLRSFLQQACTENRLSCWIGEDLLPASGCTIIAIPYRINQTTVGAIGILGPSRVPYRKLFEILKTASDAVSETLTRSIYKFKISFRTPDVTNLTLTQHHSSLLQCPLLEDKTGVL